MSDFGRFVASVASVARGDRICAECMTLTLVEAGDVCAVCARRLELLAEYHRGERAGWRAAVEFYEVDEAVGVVGRGGGVEW